LIFQKKMVIFHSSGSLPEGKSPFFMGKSTINGHFHSFFFGVLPTTPTLPRRGANKSWQVTLGQLDAPLDNSFKLWAGVSRTKKIGNTTHKRSRIVWG
jgi:hypothetical protein